MAGTLPWSSTPQPQASSDPNELLRRIDQKTPETYNWVRYGVVMVIVLLALILIGF